MSALVDFNTATGHLTDCSANDTSENPCDLACASELLAMHEAMERMLSRWDTITKTPSPTTNLLRSVRDADR